MVLSTQREAARRVVFCAAVVAVVLASTACIKRTEPQRALEATTVAVAFVQDPEGGGPVADVPEALKEAVSAELSTRNLVAEPVAFEQLQETFSRVRASEPRYSLLKEQTQAPLLLLVEVKASFFSQISGRYRWVVFAKLTGNARTAATDAATRQLDEAVVLVFDHERGPSAIAQAAPRIADAAGELFDDLLSVAGAVPGTRAPTGGTTPAQQRDVLDPTRPEAPTAPSPGGPSADPADTTGGLTLPGWGAIYFVRVDRFANGDRSNDGEVDPKDPAAFHGGDLQGLIERLDQLRALGVETVWLSPVFQMRTEKFYGHGAFHGYWVEDFNEVEPRFGDRRLLRRLSDELHARGMKLLLDVVLNHVGPETKLTRTHPHWFHNLGPLKDWSDRTQLERHDVHGLPDFAQDLPEVYRHLVDTSLRWIREVRPDGFRLDAVKHMPAEFWRRYNAELRAATGPEFLLLGEMLDGDPRVLAEMKRAGTFDAVFDFPLHFAVNDVFCKDAPATKLAVVFAADRMYEDAFKLVTLADNHDLPRVMSTCGGDLEKVKQLLLVTLTARGTPSLTWGTEVGLEGAQEPENRADMRFVEHHPLQTFIRNVLHARRTNDALIDGIPQTLVAEEERFVQLRYGAEQVALVAVNRSASASLEVTVPALLREVSWREALTNTVTTKLVVPPRSTKLFVAAAPRTEAWRSARESARAEWAGRAPPRPVWFTVSGAPLEKGAAVHLIGSAPELGAWDATKAPRVPGDGRVRMKLPQGAFAEFKLVVRRANGELAWEDGPNRPLFVRAGEEAVQVPVTWGERASQRVEPRP